MGDEVAKVDGAEDRAVESPRRPKAPSILKRGWEQLPQLASAAALVASGLFFVGWQYKQSLALQFGLSAYPGDMSFQSTVATGLTVFNAPELMLLVGAFVGAFVVVSLVRGIPRAIRKWMSSARKRLTAIGTQTRELSGIARSDKAALSSKEFGVKLRSVEWKNRLLGLEYAVLDGAINSMVAMTIIMLAVSGALVGLGMSLLFIIGGEIAERDAKDFRAEARGLCEGCFLYGLEAEGLLGVPVFQSDDAIYVQEYDELYRIELSDLETIKPFRRVSNKPLTDPRR